MDYFVGALGGDVMGCPRTRWWEDDGGDSPRCTNDRCAARLPSSSPTRSQCSAMEDDISFTAPSKTTFVAQHLVYAAVMADAGMVSEFVCLFSGTRDRVVTREIRLTSCRLVSQLSALLWPPRQP